MQLDEEEDQDRAQGMKKWRKMMSKKTGIHSMSRASNKMKSVSMLTIGLLIGSWGWGSLVVVW